MVGSWAVLVVVGWWLVVVGEWCLVVGLGGGVGWW